MKVRLLNEAPHHEDVWERKEYLHASLISAVEGGEWSASRPGQFASRKEHIASVE
jgi:hypothetical protein